ANAHIDIMTSGYVQLLPQQQAAYHT
ncbi:MAG: hypothetical protein ACI9NY_002268, partial [Kiritimatiellia bacterium]